MDSLRSNVQRLTSASSLPRSIQSDFHFLDSSNNSWNLFKTKQREKYLSSLISRVIAVSSLLLLFNTVLVEESLRESLRELGRDYISSFFQKVHHHSANPFLSSFETVLSLFARTFLCPRWVIIAEVCPYRKEDKHIIL